MFHCFFLISIRRDFLLKRLYAASNVCEYRKKNFLLFHFFFVFRAKCIACVLVVVLELNLGRDAVSVRLTVMPAVPNPIWVLEASVYTCFHTLYLVSKTSLNLSW